MSPKDAFLNGLAKTISALPGGRPMRVAVDGVDGAGKTTLANELCPLIEASGRAVIRASVDGFHNDRETRYRLGRGSPEGFFRDSYNYDALKSVLLDPLSPGGSGVYQGAIFDVENNTSVQVKELSALANSILLFDGIFLHRQELRAYWDFSIFLKVPFEISIPRGAQRGAGSPDPMAASNLRYVEGQKLYLKEGNPESFASVVVDYADLASPAVRGNASN